MPGPQPNETVKRLQQLNPYHVFRRNSLNYTFINWGGCGSNDILGKFHFMHKIAMQHPMAFKQRQG